MSQSAANPMPMFYASPRPLDRERDAKLRLTRPTSFRFAANTNAIPLLVDEFPMAASHYPIVFAAGPKPIPAVVVGLQNDTNLFVDSKDHWRHGSYLPAYVRRYPFILMDDPQNEQFVLCLDEASSLFGETGEYPLFEGDQPSAFTKSAMEFCTALRQQGEVTDEFIKALQEQNLLIPHNAEVTLPGGNKLQLSGFLVVDPNKFDALPDTVFVEWRKKGWLALIYAHFLSTHRWHDLINLSQNHS